MSVSPLVNGDGLFDKFFVGLGFREEYQHVLDILMEAFVKGRDFGFVIECQGCNRMLVIGEVSCDESFILLDLAKLVTGFLFDVTIGVQRV